MKQRPSPKNDDDDGRHRELSRQDKQNCSPIPSNKHVAIPMFLPQSFHYWAPRKEALGGTGSHQVNTRIPPTAMQYWLKHACKARVTPGDEALQHLQRAALYPARRSSPSSEHQQLRPRVSVRAAPAAAGAQGAAAGRVVRSNFVRGANQRDYFQVFCPDA